VCRLVLELFHRGGNDAFGGVYQCRFPTSDNSALQADPSPILCSLCPVRTVMWLSGLFHVAIAVPSERTKAKGPFALQIIGVARFVPACPLRRMVVQRGKLGVIPHAGRGLSLFVEKRMNEIRKICHGLMMTLPRRRGPPAGQR
jgi:hypothetical protein